MAANIWEAIKERWTAQGLDSVIGGGVWDGMVKEKTPMPYCEFSTISNAPALWSKTSQYNRTTVQFRVYGPTKAAAFTAAKSVSSAFRFAPLTWTGATVLDCRPQVNPFAVEDGKGVWSCVLSFAVLWRESVSY